MAISVQSGFQIGNIDPVDARFAVADQAARLGFATDNVYEGLIVYQQDTDELYVLNDASDPSDNNNWSQVGEGTGFPFTGSAQITGSLGVTGSISVTGSDIFINDITIGLGNGQLDSNIVFGSGAFASNTTGTASVAIGSNALASNIDTDGNLAIGQEALFNTVNNFNTGIGYRTLYSNTSGSRNTAIGRQALEDNTTGDRNTGIGQRAAEGNSTGNDNTAIGDRALVHNRSGSFNIAIGTDAARGLDQNTDFSSVTAIGAFALNSLASGSANTAIGVSSSFSLHSGSNNISIGNLSANAFESGSNNVFIGGYDGSSHTTSNSNIFISDGEGNIRLFVTGSNGSVGIGTTSPTQTLHVSSSTIDAVAKFQSSDTKAFIIIEDNGDQGFVGVQTDRLALGTNTNFTSTDNVYIKNDGNVGIGIISPSEKLEVLGNISASGFIGNGSALTNIGLPQVLTADNTARGLNIFMGEGGGEEAGGSISEVNSLSAVNITASSNISASGDIIGTNITGSNISASGDIIGNTGSFNNINVTGEYTLPTSDGSANQIIQTNGSGILSFTTPTPVPTIYTPDVYEIQSVTGITSTNTLLTFRGSGDPTVIDGTTGTTRTEGVDDSITFNSEGIFEISYSVQMQQGASTGGTRMNPQVYAKFGTSGATAVAAGSSNVTYIRLIGSNQAPNGACTCTFYINVTDSEHILELLVAFTQPATNIDLDIVQFSSVQNTLSIRKIT